MFDQIIGFAGFSRNVTFEQALKLSEVWTSLRILSQTGAYRLYTFIRKLKMEQ